jgi:hypothetical protein
MAGGATSSRARDTARCAPAPNAQKLHHYEPIRQNRWAVRLGYLLGRGKSSKDVAAEMGDGTHPATVRAMAKLAGLLPDVPRQAVLPIRMASWQRDAIAGKAAELGIEPDVLALRILESAIVLDDLYAAVTDGRYDNDNAVYRKARGAK